MLRLTPVGERVQLTVKRKGVTQNVALEVAPADDITRTGSITRRLDPGARAVP